ncbi:hypothetical protein DPQ22_01475 [Candidatus Tokpelaia sp.]|nr:hypothetical protein DPQ22_01475 [Candidatus Tokpelaia sp.]
MPFWRGGGRRLMGGAAQSRAVCSGERESGKGMRQQGCALPPPGLILCAGRFKILSAICAGNEGEICSRIFI